MKAKTIACMAWAFAVVGGLLLIGCAWTSGRGDTSEALGGTAAVLFGFAVILAMFAGSAYDNERLRRRGGGY